MLCIPVTFINYPLSSTVLHVNLMFDLFMKLWWVPFYDFVCVPDYSFLCVKDKVHKLNFITLFGLCWNIYTSQRLVCLTLIWSMFTCKVFRNIFCNFLPNYIFLQHTNMSFLEPSQ